MFTRQKIQKILSDAQIKYLNDEGVKINWENNKISIFDNSGESINILLILELEIKIISYKKQSFEYAALLFRNDVEQPERIILTSDEIINCCEKSLMQRFGCKDTGKYGVLISKIIQKSAFFAEKTEIYEFNGWSADSKNRYFLCGTKKITAQGIEIIENRVANDISAVDISIKDSCRFIAENYLHVLNNRLFSQIFLCYAVLANVHQLIKDAGSSVDFMLYVFGETGTGKTSTTFPLLNPFNVGNFSVTDSKAAAMGIIDNNLCSVTIMDDVKARKNKKSVETLDAISRLAGDKTTGERRRCGNKVSDITLHNMLAATAEIDPPLQESSFPRLLILKFDRSTVNVENLKNMEKNIEEFKGKTVAFITYFIEECLKNHAWGEQIRDQFNQECKYLIDSRDEHLHGRYYNIMSWMIVIWREIRKFCSLHECELPNENFEEELKAMIIRQHLKYSEKKPAMMYCKALHELMECNTLKCIDNDNIKEAVYFDIIINNGLLQIRSRCVYQKIRQYYMDRDIDFNWTERSIRNELKREGLLRLPDGNKSNTTFERKINGVSCSFMNLYAHKISDFIKEE